MRLRGGSVQGRAVTAAAAAGPAPPRRSTADAPAPGNARLRRHGAPASPHPLAGPAIVVAADGAGLAEGGVQRALVHLRQAVGGDDDAPRRTEPSRARNSRTSFPFPAVSPARLRRQRSPRLPRAALRLDAAPHDHSSTAIARGAGTGRRPRASTELTPARNTVAEPVRAAPIERRQTPGRAAAARADHAVPHAAQRSCRRPQRSP